jgi:hypothetical protein
MNADQEAFAGMIPDTFYPFAAHPGWMTGGLLVFESI